MQPAHLRGCLSASACEPRSWVACPLTAVRAPAWEETHYLWKRRSVWGIVWNCRGTHTRLYMRLSLGCIWAGSGEQDPAQRSGVWQALPGPQTLWEDGPPSSKAEHLPEETPGQADGYRLVGGSPVRSAGLSLRKEIPCTQPFLHPSVRPSVCSSTRLCSRHRCHSEQPAPIPAVV